jgi:hypothetical protein
MLLRNIQRNITSTQHKTKHTRPIALWRSQTPAGVRRIFSTVITPFISEELKGKNIDVD